MKACWSRAAAARWCEASSECGVESGCSLPLSLNGAENQQHPPTETTAGARVPSTCPVFVSSARERTDDKSTIPHQHRHIARHWAATTNKHPPLPYHTPTLISPLCATLSWTQRAARKHRSALEIHRSAFWIRKKRTATRAACLPRVRHKMLGRA